jgi:hypothetical protein
MPRLVAISACMWCGNADSRVARTLVTHADVLSCICPGCRRQLTTAADAVASGLRVSFGRPLQLEGAKELMRRLMLGDVES